jgi:hypothetical protein
MSWGEAKIQLLLSERHGSQFSTEIGRRWVSFKGEYKSENKLNGKTFHLEFYEGNYYEAIKKSRDQETISRNQQPTRSEILENSIGVVNVSPNAQISDRWTEPFHAHVLLSRSDFDAALNLIDVTLNEGRVVSVTLNVRSAQIDPEMHFARIEDVDLSNGFQGFVFEFCVNRTFLQRIPPELRAVRAGDKATENKSKTTIVIPVSSVYVSYSMPAGWISVLSCEGVLQNQRTNHSVFLDSAKCSINFQEYEAVSRDLYPTGDFSWHKNARSLDINLRYRTADLAGPLASLIYAGGGDSVRLDVTLVTDIENFGIDDQYGDTSYWSVKHFRKLGEAKPKGWFG